MLIGLTVINDPAAVRAMSRTGNPREILCGPLFGIVALMLMCGGDGLADIAGRRWGHARLPWAPRKSWAGID